MEGDRQSGSGRRRAPDVLVGALVFALGLQGLLDLGVAWMASGLRGLEEPDRHHVEGAVVILRILAGMVLAGTAVPWLTWSGRAVARTNARAGYPVAGSPARAVWPWFVPLLNLWMPYEAMRRLWRANAVGGEAVLGLWWLAWILGHAVLTWTDAIRGRPSLDEFDAWLVAHTVGRVLLACAAALAIVVVLRIASARGERTPKSARSPA